MSRKTLVEGSRIINKAEVGSYIPQLSWHCWPAPPAEVRVKLMETAMETVMAKATVTRGAILMATARAKVTAEARVTVMAKAELKVKVRDRQREGRFVAPADFVTNARSRQHSAARLVVEAEHS
ncbi:MAG TPA: hypothetical protein VGW76_02180 [Pyrinomonadaceae bacterium]|nr:hypothetical protein [Pyrinomonadaceae bacterium]